MLIFNYLSETTGSNFSVSSSSSSLEADLSLHTLSESPCGSLVVYVIPESSSLLPEVKTHFLIFFFSMFSFKEFCLATSCVCIHMLMG